MRSCKLLVLISLLGIALSAIPSASASKLHVYVNTGSLSGAGSLSFAFVDNDNSANNTALISNFSTDGVLGAVTQRIGPAAGTLPGSLTINDDPLSFPVLYEQLLTFNSFFRFDLELTNFFSPGIGLTPDVFDLVLLDSTGTAVPTTDVVDALFWLEATVTPPAPCSTSLPPPIPATA